MLADEYHATICTHWKLLLEGGGAALLLAGAAHRCTCALAGYLRNATLQPCAQLP